MDKRWQDLMLKVGEIFARHPLPWTHHVLMIKDAAGRLVIHLGGSRDERGATYDPGYLVGLAAMLVDYSNSLLPIGAFEQILPACPFCRVPPEPLTDRSPGKVACTNRQCGIFEVPMTKAMWEQCAFRPSWLEHRLLPLQRLVSNHYETPGSDPNETLSRVKNFLETGSTNLS